MRVVEHHTIGQLAALAKAIDEARLVRRVYAVIEAKRGAGAVEIGAAFAVSRRTVQEWVERYNREGLDGLRDRPGRGRRPKLSPAQREAFRERMLAGPTDADGGVCTLRGKDALRILEQQFGVVQSLSGAYLTLARAGLTALRPRPKHPKSDPVAVARWEKNAPLLYAESARNAGGHASRSGSRTRRGSGNRAR